MLRARNISISGVDVNIQEESDGKTLEKAVF